MDVNGAIRDRRTQAHHPRRNKRCDKLPSELILGKLTAVLRNDSVPKGQWMRRISRTEYESEKLVLSGQFWTVDEVAHDYLSSQFLSKFCRPDDKSGAAIRAERAIAKFMKAEEMCRITNMRLASPFKPVFQDRFDCGTIFMIACRKIGELLRVCDCNHRCNCIEVLCNDLCDFGPGGTTSRPRRLGDKSHKFIGNNECTSGNLALAIASLNARPLWLQGLISEGASIVINDRDKITTVPKNSEIDRVICSQPDLNAFTQKGFGRLLRARLKTVGVDLKDQTLNQDLALIGSLFEGLATIDLSMASDTVSLEIVRQLLPVDWFLALEQCRVPETVLPDGSVHTYHKFSAMGNGYTFELESLIFWALTRACVEVLALKDRRFAIYGDDIVCPVDAVPLLQEVLEYCGFVFNGEKSFWDSPFRESCGKHFFEGVDVTPFYVRRPVDTIQELFLLHNNVWRWLLRVNSHITARNRRAWWEFLDFLKKLVPKAYEKCRIPDGFGDGGLVGSFDWVRPRPANGHMDGYMSHVLVKVPKRSRKGNHGWLCKALSGAEHSFDDLFTKSECSTLAPVLDSSVWRVMEIFIPRSSLA